MSLPSATYRLQFRNGMTFERAVGLIAHWQSLGISHVYASPIFAATKGSTHGYDVIDPNSVEADIGGRAGFDLFVAALKRAGLGLILDIVPNHLAASLENPWWRSIIEWGAESPYAHYFDVDWSHKLTLPVMSAPLDEELAAGNIKLVIDAEHAALAIEYMGSRYPLHPKTYRTALASLDHPMAPDMVALRNTEILELQPWRFIPWREASNGLSYRRFFEITGLAGARVEEPDVFHATHQTVLDMVRRGQVDGLRIDHIDGLADPEAYLNQLREAVGPDIYIVVEKILERDEQLPEEWPVEGTTGYEFIAAVADVLSNHRNPALDEAYRRISPENADAEEALLRAKQLMVDRNFRGEVSDLQRLACAIADAEDSQIHHALIQAAVHSVLIAFPVYRTYGSPRGLHPADSQVLQDIFDRLIVNAPPDLNKALLFVHNILKGRVRQDNAGDASRFRTRMQHLTGPLLAKALEDTFFYRYNRLLALNEVGGDPLGRDGSPEQFHAKMQARALRQPAGLTATSTHDTKRGEDARARLYALSEAPDLWTAAVERWRDMHRRLVVDLPDGPAPEPNVEWMLYQALAGVWPPDLDITSSDQLAGLKQRFLPYVEKALREAKQRTDWADSNRDYEEAVARYASALLSPDNAAFLRDFAETLRPFIATGLINSLSQTLLKLTAPGIPDIYQGCEALDFSLVDPDNRRPLDFEHLADDRHAVEKPGLIASVLAVRRQQLQLFTAGQYIPLEVEGGMSGHIVAFARSQETGTAVVIVPRLVFDFVADGSVRVPELWRGTCVILPDQLRHPWFTNMLTGKLIDAAEGRIAIDAAFATQPYALLIAGANH
jgi:(1->4)-alpha-D-glucan 1-alpha-D-glucosylmutase